MDLLKKANELLSGIPDVEQESAEYKKVQEQLLLLATYTIAKADSPRELKPELQNTGGSAGFTDELNQAMAVALRGAEQKTITDDINEMFSPGATARRPIRVFENC